MLTAAADFKLAADWIFFFNAFAASIKNLWFLFILLPIPLNKLHPFLTGGLFWEFPPADSYSNFFFFSFPDRNRERHFLSPALTTAVEAPANLTPPASGEANIFCFSLADVLNYWSGWLLLILLSYYRFTAGLLTGSAVWSVVLGIASLLCTARGIRSSIERR